MSDSNGFAEMVEASAQSELDRLAHVVGNLAADVDELKRQPSWSTEIVQALMTLGKRVVDVEAYLKQRLDAESVTQHQMERQTRYSALDLAVKACFPTNGPPMTTDEAREAAAACQVVAEGFLVWLRGGMH